MVICSTPIRLFADGRWAVQPCSLAPISPPILIHWSPFSKRRLGRRERGDLYGAVWIVTHPGLLRPVLGRGLADDDDAHDRRARPEEHGQEKEAPREGRGVPCRLEYQGCWLRPPVPELGVGQGD